MSDATLQPDLTLEEMAQLMRVHGMTLRRLAQAGLAPGVYKCGRLWRFNRQAVERLREGLTLGYVYGDDEKDGKASDYIAPQHRTLLSQPEPTKAPPEPDLDLQQFARLLKVHTNTLLCQVRRGTAPGAYKVGRQWRFCRETVQRWRDPSVLGVLIEAVAWEGMTIDEAGLRYRAHLMRTRLIHRRKERSQDRRREGMSEATLQPDLILQEMAQLMGVRPATLTLHAQRGQVPGAYKIGRLWRFNRQVVERLREESALGYVYDEDEEDDRDTDNVASQHRGGLSGPAPTEAAPEPDLDLHGLARLLGVHTMTLRRQAQTGRVPGAYKLGRQWRFCREAVQRWRDPSVLGELIDAAAREVMDIEEAALRYIVHLRQTGQIGGSEGR